MKREELLQKAIEITKGARQEHYGSPEDNFKRIADYWSLWLESEIEPEDVAVMMILMKVARLTADVNHEDSWLDIAGYAACGSQVTNG